MKAHADRVCASSRALETVPTGWAPRLPRLGGIRLAAFDVYGTLLISAAGGGRHEASPGGEPEAEFAAEAEFERLFWEHVRIHQDRKRALGVAHPEIEIREVWADLLARLGRPALAPAQLEDAILEHECLSNPTWPMPGAVAMLGALRARGLPMGLISNAQFYTVPVMEGLLGRDLEGLGFREGLRVFSYLEGEGKPSPRLFERFRERAAALGVAPEQIFYLGNDLHKDVLPARAAGFRTGLFAGDARGLRLGGVAPEEARDLADAVVTDLAQVPAMLQ